MITPTLFVGLGTTGTEILMKLRELMYEEYGLGGLPIFRYIAIETDQDMEGKLKNTNQMKGYERIRFVRASIDNFNRIKRKLAPNDIEYNEHLDDWLNQEVLNFAQSFTTGAGHIRSAGRLCLWENWDNMQNVLSTAQGAIRAPASINMTNNILGNHFNTKGLNIDGNMVGANTHIYIVGSLCGGTCSGMLVDMAYYCRGLIGERDGNEIRGMFTMYDEYAATNTVVQPDDDLRKAHSANCYSGLWELNYYNHPKTTYDVVLPTNSGRVNSPDRIPFNETMLISCSGKDQGNFVDEEGKPDLDCLNLMVALNLFAESVGDTRGLKRRMGINGQALAGYGQLKTVRVGETTVMMRNMASFGLTAVWYPKYRIANATASLVGQKVCKNWRKSHIREATIIQDAREKWEDIRDANIGTLTSTVKTEIDEHLGKLKQARPNKNASSAALKKSLENFPKDGSFTQKFAEGGQYIELMKMQVRECQEAFRNAIEDTFNTQLGTIDFENTRGLEDVEIFFNKLDDQIKQEIGNCPLQLPTLSLDGLHFKQSKSFWLWSLGLQDASVESHQRDIIGKYCDFIGGSENSFYKEVRKYFLRPILEEIRAELGFGVPPRETDAPNRRLTIKERLGKIDTNLENCTNQFEDVYKDAITPKKSECVKIVTNNDENSIAKDAELLSHQIIEQGGGGGLLDETTMTTFLQKEHQEIVNQLTTTYRGISLNRMRNHDVVREVQRYVADDNPEITNLANRSNPYQMFEMNNYQPLLANPPKIIFGRDSLDNVLPQLENRLGFSNSGDCSVDHLLLFYQEEYGFTIDDLRVFPVLKTHFRENPLGNYGHSTHKDPDFYNLELYAKIEKLQNWCRALNRLVPKICQHIEEDAFLDVFYNRDGYFYQYPVDGINERLYLQGHGEEIKTLSQNQHADNYHKFFNRVCSCFNELNRQEVENLINLMLGDIAENDLRRSLTNIYRNFINEVYSYNDSIDNAELNPDIDTHFDQPSPQPQEADTSDAEADNITPPDQYGGTVRGDDE